MTQRAKSASAPETEAVGARLAALLSPGDVVVVAGELGAGKTTFIRGACRALGVDAPITSPTFEIGHVYLGRIEVAHVDLYRLPGLEREDPALLDDYLIADRVGFVEWPAAAGDAIDRVAARVTIEHPGGDRRRIEIETWTCSA